MTFWKFGSQFDTFSIFIYFWIDLPSSSQIHPVFHVSQLKQMIGTATTSTAIPESVSDVFIKEPEDILERKMVKRQGRAATKVLIKWKNTPVDEASWEFLFDITQKFPAFKP